MKSLTLFKLLPALVSMVYFGCSSPTGHVSGGGPADDFPNAVVVTARSETGGPLQDASVFIRTSDYVRDTSLKKETPLPDGTTGPDGNFIYGNINTGEYVVSVFAKNGEVCGISSVSFSSDSGSIITDTVICGPAGGISGNIKIIGISDNFAFIQVPGLDILGSSDPLTGSFSIENIPAGTHTIRFLAEGPDYGIHTLSDVEIVSGPARSVDTVTLLPFGEEDYTQWSFSQSICLNTTPAGAAIDSDLVKFPVLITLDGSSFAFDQAGGTGEDIRFAKPDGTRLPYEIEIWDSLSAAASIWVLIDTVKGDDSTQIMMFWGKESAADFSNGAAVFDTSAGFTGVWHMNNLLDATPNGLHAASTEPPAQTDGISGGAMRFDGTSSYLRVADSPELHLNGTFTLSLWARWNTGQAPGYNRLVSKKQEWYSSTGFELMMIPGDDDAFDVRGSGDPGYGPQNVLDGWSQGGWHHITLVWDKNLCAIYCDGEYIQSPELDAYDNNTDLAFGALAGNLDAVWNGDIDEIRISEETRSSAWIKLCYINQFLPDNFIELSE